MKDAISLDERQKRSDEWVEAITLALTWVPLSYYDDVQKRAERAMTEMLDLIDDLEGMERGSPD